MKKLAIGLMVFSFAACGGEEKDDTNPGQTTACTAAQLGSTKCEGDKLMECNGTVYSEKENCATTNKICQEFFAGVARCEEETPPAGMFETCTGTGQGNCEDSSLVCGEVTLLSDGDLCLVDCSGGASVCTTLTIDGQSVPGYCEPGTIEGGGAFSSTPFCFWVSDRNGMCLFNDDGCTGSELTCQSITDGLNPECKLNCPGNEVNGGQGSCPSGDVCLRAPYVEIEESGGNDVTCSNVGTQDNCSSGYMCTEVAVSDTATENLCARRAGLCGQEVTAAGPFGSQSEVSTWINEDTNICDLLGYDQYCGADDAGGAVNECISSNYAFRYDPAIPCGGFDDYLGCFGLGECITFDGVNFECGVGIGICQRFCTKSDGTTAGTCDGGDTCQTPAYPVGRPAIQFDTSGDPVFCDSASGGPGNCDIGFTCDTETFSDADVCTKVRQVCGS